MLNLAFMLTTDTTTNPNNGSWVYLIMIGLIVVMFIFMNRSQKKKDKEAADMRDSLQVGDEVTTIGGIIGKVVSVKGETFVLESTKDKTKIRFLKGAIRSIDVKAADIAAAVLETKTVAKEEPVSNAPSVEAPVEGEIPADENTEEKK